LAFTTVVVVVVVVMVVMVLYLAVRGYSTLDKVCILPQLYHMGCGWRCRGWREIEGGAYVLSGGAGTGQILVRQAPRVEELMV
jgi:hypothetical protein